MLEVSGDDSHEYSTNAGFHIYSNITVFVRMFMFLGCRDLYKLVKIGNHPRTPI